MDCGTIDDDFTEPPGNQGHPSDCYTSVGMQRLITSSGNNNFLQNFVWKAVDAVKAGRLVPLIKEEPLEASYGRIKSNEEVHYSAASPFQDTELSEESRKLGFVM